MKFALFLGCKIPSGLPAYEKSTRAVLAHLGVTVVDLPFDCCGYPARNYNRDAFVVAAARNLALAERAGLDVITPCMCCFGTLRHAIRFLAEDAALRTRVEESLAAEGLGWSGTIGVEHLLPVLARHVGLDVLAAAVRAPRTDARIAAQYGCHALRPSDVTGFDNPLAPTIFESLIRVTGATPVAWSRRLDCCGDPLHEGNPALADHVTRAKIVDALESGAGTICTACPHCHQRLDAVQAATPDAAIGTLLYPQLLGLAMGLPAESLGLPHAEDQRGDALPEVARTGLPDRCSARSCAQGGFRNARGRCRGRDGVGSTRPSGRRRRLRLPAGGERRHVSRYAALPRLDRLAVLVPGQIALDDGTRRGQVGQPLPHRRQRDAHLLGDLQIKALTVLLQALQDVRHGACPSQ